MAADKERNTFDKNSAFQSKQNQEYFAVRLPSAAVLTEMKMTLEMSNSKRRRAIKQVAQRGGIQSQ